ncbi:MAG: hypothetical protein IID59_12215 [Proteobacteria bacterium]|nr:hypothetical protein [Pseudomonadota bacterium]
MNELDTATLDGSASRDPDGSISTFEWRQVSGLTVTINNSDQALADFVAPEVTPANEDLVFEITISDNSGATASDTVTISVVNVNVLPAANAGADQIVFEGSTVVLDAAGSTDLDGIVTGFFWQLLSGRTVDIPTPDQAQISFVAPSTNETYTNEFELTVTDDLGGTNTDIVSVVIRPIIPPIADAGADQLVESESTVILTALASSDIDGEIVSYQWTQLIGPAVTLSSSTTLETSFAAPLVSENTLLQFELLVTDDSNATATDVIDVTVTPPTYIVSGTITVPDGNVVDSDVNNLDAPYAPNDSPDTAQILPNPVTVGGYANRRNRGPSGRSQLIGDQQDFYRGVLTVGQTITLRIEDAASGDLDLYLWDLAGTTIVAASLGITEFETVVAPSDGEYVIEIFVFSGASNYVLNLETTGAPASASAGYNLDNDFMPTEAIVRYRDTLGKV